MINVPFVVCTHAWKDDSHPSRTFEAENIGVIDDSGQLLSLILSVLLQNVAGIGHSWPIVIDSELGAHHIGPEDVQSK